MDPELDRAVAALQDPTRRSILLRFYQDPRPRTVDQVAEEAGVHRTVAFGHLERLRALGYLSAGSRRGLRGKPARLYALESGPLELNHPPRRFRLLASLLGESIVRTGARGRRAAHDAGHAFGAAHGRPARGRARSVDEALKQLEELGGSYELCEDRINVCNCVFHEACQDGVACEVHAGILEGFLSNSGMEAQVRPLGRAAEGCSYLLEVR
jgi:predicted ArsR family transcriptional regulator